MHMPSGCYSQSLIHHQAATANHADTADRVPQNALRAPEVNYPSTPGIDLDVKASNRETMGLPLIVPSGSEQLNVVGGLRLYLTTGDRSDEH